MKKVIHIHTDQKFLSDSDRYFGDFFDNELIILGAKNSFSKEYHNKVQFFNLNSGNLNELLAKLNTADILVMYHLDLLKTPIINRVNKRIKIVWRFFGSELYSRKLHLYLSPKSKPFFIPKLIKGKIKSVFPFFFQKERLFHKAIRRSDAITGIFKEEYDYLSRYWNHLPKFIPLSFEGMPFHEEVIDFESEYPKNNTIVIGNSRSSFNNHLEILELIETCSLNDKINPKILFNYGVENDYTAKVREKATGIEKASLIDTFMPPDEFIKFYGSVAAFVTNSYRQLAIGNIMVALNKGAKVYLSKKNPTYTWLKNEGVRIYEIESLKNDLETGKIHLAKSEIVHNLKRLRNLKESYTKTDFQLQIMQLLNK